MKRGLLVLGMHRSGTSALTRTLSFLGAELPRTLIPAHPSNVTGHWESRDLAAVHEELLAAAGSSWRDFRPLDQGWLRSPPAAPFRARLAAILARDFGGSRLFVVKDPRVCRLVGLWRELVQDLGAEPVAVLAVRNPLEVAASLERRDGIPLAESLLLWLRHVLDAERDSRGLRRAVVTYESLLRDPRAAVESLTARLGIDWPISPEAARPSIEGFLAAEHRHHAATAAELEARPDVSPWVKDVFCALTGLAEGRDGRETLDRVAGELDRATPAFAPLLASRAKLEALTRESEARSAEARALRRQVVARDTLVGGLAATLRADPTLPDLAAVAASGLFDRAWYLATYPDVAAASVDPLRHYLSSGRAARRSPNAYFDASWYLETYPDVAAAAVDPLLHYLRHGGKEGRDPGPRFDAAGYLATQAQAAASGLTPLAHYLLLVREDATPGHVPHVPLETSGLFDREAYCARNPGVAAADAVAHYLSRPEPRPDPNPLFDSRWYLDTNPDVAAAGVDPFRHFLLCGATEGRNPGPGFDTAFYRATCPDVGAFGLNPLAHYLTRGRREGRACLPPGADRP